MLPRPKCSTVNCCNSLLPPPSAASQSKKSKSKVQESCIGYEDVILHRFVSFKANTVTTRRFLRSGTCSCRVYKNEEVLLLVVLICTLESLPHRILLDTDVDTDDLFALLYLLKQNRSELEAVTINVNACTNAGHSVNQVYDILYMMGRDDIAVGVGGDGGILEDGTILPNVGGYLPVNKTVICLAFVLSTLSICRNVIPKLTSRHKYICLTQKSYQTIFFFFYNCMSSAHGSYLCKQG
ncbi:nucleoside hydrolase 3-like isoform X2 [Fagus crenata]